jgi:hypothetical protein
MIMFLCMNRHLWDINDVATACHKDFVPDGGPVDDDDDEE